MNILITGGFGYLGARLALELSNKSNYKLYLGTRDSKGPPEWLPTANVSHTNWNQPTTVDHATSDIDTIVHMSGMNARNCVADPVAALEFNGLVTARLLQAAINNGVRRFVYLSTAHVYNSPLTGVITEKNCTLSTHPYATSHRAGEDVVIAAHQRGDIEGIVIRLSNAFGAPVLKDTNCWMLLVNDLCSQAMTNQTLVLKTSGLQRRDFIAMSDVVRALTFVLDLSKEKTGNGIFNVGGQWSPRIIDMAEIIQTCCKTEYGFSPEIVRPIPESHEESHSLDYRIDKLMSAGFVLEKETQQEIVATLKLCS
ncbi:MAG: NAD-dependent epimerase/dehydratase family protein [Thiohalomonadales bacterium]